jgi:cysteine desulfurase
MDRIDFDRLSGLPVRPEVLEAMRPWWIRGDSPGAVHSGGVRARGAIARAREQVAAFLGASTPEEIVFTASATESTNLAVKGTAWARRNQGDHIVLTSVEHPAVLESVAFLQEQGFRTTRVPVDSVGRVAVGDVCEAMTDQTVLACVQHANLDIGTLQPVEQVCLAAANRGVPVFVDASASAGWLPVDAKAWGATLVSVAPHRFGAPRGVGILYRDRRAPLKSLVHGGGQEQGFRAGVENVAGIVGTGVAAELAGRELAARASQARVLQAACWRAVLERVPFVRLNGPEPGPGRLPNQLNVSVEFVEGEGLALALDLQGVAVHTGAACVTRSNRLPPVLEALRVHPSLGRSTLLFSFDTDNTEAQVTAMVAVLERVVERLRGLSPAWEDFRLGLQDSVIRPRCCQ